jgi:hypothetical protein
MRGSPRSVPEVHLPALSELLRTARLALALGPTRIELPGAQSRIVASPRLGRCAGASLAEPKRRVFDDVASDNIFEKAIPVVHLFSIVHLSQNIGCAPFDRRARAASRRGAFLRAVAAESLGKAPEKAGSFAAPGTPQPSVRRAEDRRYSRSER